MMGQEQVQQETSGPRQTPPATDCQSHSQTSPPAAAEAANLAQVQAMLGQLAAGQQALWQQLHAWQQEQMARPAMPLPPQSPYAGPMMGYPPQPPYPAYPAYPAQEQPHGRPVTTHGPPPQASACEHHDPAQSAQQQTEHFLELAQKFSRGEMNLSDVAGGLSQLTSPSGSFWKGVLIGGGLTLLVSNDGIREALTGLFRGGNGSAADATSSN